MAARGATQTHRQCRTIQKTTNALCGLISGLLLLAAGTQVQADLLVTDFIGNKVEKFDSVTGANLGTFANGGAEARNSMYQLSFGYIDSTLIPTPEPMSAALLLGSGAMLLLRRRRTAV